ncbi:SigE family RNA polymerase sigma factor [Nocardioides baculatus]|uniref:SigE family RNA polymerase sigma factor n=1 Tax=Nocardioides baculatus TaxID=2801337 RepID=A0ABS1L6Q9_9ACTN|nr:SigE family RNA polymerase sigma factor [Nocardioides baculatus]MBL0747222.1 SigE family RNA polymerase sigma factor [Nocardioides baculatus]
MTRHEQDADFADFVHASWPGLYRTAHLLLGDHGLAEDLTQTALAKTYVAWARVRERDAAYAYARTTLVNTATSWFRRRSWRNELPREDAGLDVLGRHPDPSDRPAVMDALAALPPRQRAVVVLRFYDDLSVAQTADALGCSPGTVKSQTSVALARLRELIGDQSLPNGARS